MRDMLKLNVLSFANVLTLGVYVAFCLASMPFPAQASETNAERASRLYNTITWVKGPATASLGSHATIDVPAGFQFTGTVGAKTWAEINENLADDTLDGVLMPVNLSWFLNLHYNDIGHVPDNEKGSLDADAILRSIREGTDAGNIARRQHNWPELHVVDWIHPPSYDAQSNHLVWAIKLQSTDGVTGNYRTEILGRTGIMSAVLVADIDSLPSVIPAAKQLLSTVRFTPGNTYAEWRSGDRMAQYGLTGLITGGATVTAAKTGLLSKLGGLIAKSGKGVAAACVALLAGLWKLLTGKCKADGKPAA
ncbi:MAG TPA: DUF2167 domain-containing protein [Pirellulales bacterium]|jgi:uncharacterized membrane-anchored protein